MKLEQALQVLELSPGCSFLDAKKSYKDLVQVWHSDRHQHNDRLAKRAKQKMQTLNEAWHLISALGESQFNERVKIKLEKRESDEREGQFTAQDNAKAKQQPSFRQTESGRRFDLKSYQSTGILLTPIWHMRGVDQPRVGKGKRLQATVAIGLLLTGLFMAPRLYHQIQLGITGRATNAQIAICGSGGENSVARIEGDKVAIDLPRSMLRIALSEKGEVLFTCPDYFSVIYSKSHPDITRIGGNMRNLWISLLAQLFCFCLFPLLFLIRLRKSQE